MAKSNQHRQLLELSKPVIVIISHETLDTIKNNSDRFKQKTFARSQGRPVDVQSRAFARHGRYGLWIHTPNSIVYHAQMYHKSNIRESQRLIHFGGNSSFTAQQEKTKVKRTGLKVKVSKASSVACPPTKSSLRAPTTA